MSTVKDPKGSSGKEVEITTSLTVVQLAEKLGMTAPDVQRDLMNIGVLAQLNMPVSMTHALKVAEGRGIPVKLPAAAKKKAAQPAPQPKKKRRRRTAGPVDRPPVVVVMGHVDHGKTTFLDAVRHTRVTEQEFGGITQHIGAFQVEVEVDGQQRTITFLDTPGHEAFTRMRGRGAQVADIAILVVAADDGIMPQTLEALDHARAAELPIVVAINKIDLAEANVPRLLGQLAEHDLLVQSLGGETESFEISALKELGLEELLEGVILMSDIEVQPKADPIGPAEGTVIEARMDAHRGAVATALIESGTLHSGDAVVAGGTFGKIKAMTDDQGKKLREAGPSAPVEILGLNSVPEAGDVMRVCESEREARQLAQQRATEMRDERVGVGGVSFETIFQQLQQGEIEELNVIVKGDVQGSVEAVCDSLENLADGRYRAKIVRSGVGLISAGDIQLAGVTNSLVLGFNVKADSASRRVAQEEGVEIRTYQVIYELVEAVETTLKGLLPPEYREISLGQAEVRAAFQLPGNRMAAGCVVVQGRVLRDADARVLRGGDVLVDGSILSLRHFKDNVREVAAGSECGILVEGYEDPQEGDILEIYEMEQIPVT